MIIKKKLQWKMGHALDTPYEGDCTRCHGHNFEVEFAYEGEPDNKGMVVDFRDFKKMQTWLNEHLDHRFLVKNTHLILEPYIEGPDEFMLEIEQLGLVPVSWNPTTENIAKFLHEVCSDVMNLDSKKLTVTVWETAQSSATYMEG